MSNFDFLDERFPSLARFGRLAEKYWTSDPGSALMKMGQMGETMVNLIFQYEHIPLSTWDSNAALRINQLRDEGWITPDLAEALHVLRKARNDAAHEDRGTPEKAERLLPVAYSLAEWFMETYGDWQYRHHDFVMPPADPEGALRAAAKAAEKRADEATQEADYLRAQAAAAMEKGKRKAQSRRAAASRVKPEAEARAVIDRQLQRAGWEADTWSLRYSKGTRPDKKRNLAIAEWPVAGGERADYALFAGTTLVGLIEAKKKGTPVASAIDGQCDEYARHILTADGAPAKAQWGSYRVPFVFAANGGAYQSVPGMEAYSGLWFRDLRQASNQARPLRDWMSPEGLLGMLDEDPGNADQRLLSMDLSFLQDGGLHLRPYQMDAVRAAIHGIAEGKRNLLLALATGTGKTLIALGLMYTLIKARRFRRVLFLVDRNLLADQAIGKFQSIRVEKNLTLTNIYTVQDDGKIDLSNEVKVQVATVQSMIRRLRDADNENAKPVSSSDYDLIIVDEAHRGYNLDKDMGEEEKLWRDPEDYLSKYKKVLDYFDAVRIGLTATPALETTEIFGAPVFTYSYTQGVMDGYLADHDAPVELMTDLAKHGIHYKAGEKVNYFFGKDLDVKEYTVPDKLDFDVSDFNRKVINQHFDETVIDMLAPHLHPEDRKAGKTLIFAVSDIHADRLVTILRKAFPALPPGAIRKITGASEGGDSKKIKNLADRFKNEMYPSIAVTVDLLTTGYDAPSITSLVFLRQVKSRILFEQMIGRAVRLCDDIEKTHFTIYDAVGACRIMNDLTTMKPVVQDPSLSMADLLDRVRDIENEKTLIYPVRQIVARLRRQVHGLSKEQRKQIGALTGGMTPEALIDAIADADPKEARRIILDGKEAIFAFHVPASGRLTFLSDKADKPAEEAAGVTEPASTYGSDKDYLEDFSEYIKTHKNDIAALRILCTRPQDLTLKDLNKLAALLQQDGFTVDQLNQAERDRTGQALTADLITFIRRAAIGSPLVDHKERVRRAVARLEEAHMFSLEAKQWLHRIEQILMNESIIYPGYFDEDDRFKRKGGFSRIDKCFKGKLSDLLTELNIYLYDKGDKQA